MLPGSKTYLKEKTVNYLLRLDNLYKCLECLDRDYDSYNYQFIQDFSKSSGYKGGGAKGYYGKGKLNKIKGEESSKKSD